MAAALAVLWPLREGSETRATVANVLGRMRGHLASLQHDGNVTADTRGKYFRWAPLLSLSATLEAWVAEPPDGGGGGSGADGGAQSPIERVVCAAEVAVLAEERRHAALVSRSGIDAIGLVPVTAVPNPRTTLCCDAHD